MDSEGVGPMPLAGTGLVQIVSGWQAGMPTYLSEVQEEGLT